MELSLEKRCELFIQNRQILGKEFPLDNPMLHSICAGFFADREKLADPEDIRKCKGLLRECRGFFAGSTGFPLLPMASFLAACESPENQLAAVKEAYTALRREFYASEQLSLAAFFLSERKPQSEFDETVAAVKAMRNTFSVVSPELLLDSGYAPFLFFVLSGKNAVKCAEESEYCRVLLKKEFYSPNAVKAMSLIFSLSDKPSSVKCGKVTRLFDDLKKEHCKFAGDEELSALAALSLLFDDPIPVLLETQKFLNKPNAWRVNPFSRKEQLTWAALLLIQDKEKSERLLVPFCMSLLLVQSMKNTEALKRMVKF